MPFCSAMSSALISKLNRSMFERTRSRWLLFGSTGQPYCTAHRRSSRASSTEYHAAIAANGADVALASSADLALPSTWPSRHVESGASEE